MQKHHNLTILGTSHISEASIKEIEKEFNSSNPEIVAVELDRQRLYSLLKAEKPNYSPRLIARVGVSGYLFALIGGLLQKKLGSVVGIAPGSDMLHAANLAIKNNKKLTLIDRPIDVTLRRLSQEFTFKQKTRLIWDILRSPFSKKISFDLSKVPEKQLIRQLLSLLKKRYPGLHKALIEERNEHMASRLAGIVYANPESKILSVVGAGHEEELFFLFKKKLTALKNQRKYI
jgi:pheromone shutdown-related protein TraB